MPNGHGYPPPLTPPAFRPRARPQAASPPGQVTGHGPGRSPQNRFDYPQIGKANAEQVSLSR